MICQLNIMSVYRIWPETAERNFGFLTMLKIVDFTGPTHLFGLLKKPKFLSAVSRRKLTSGDI